MVIALRSCINAAVRAKAGGLESFEFPFAPKHPRIQPEDEYGDGATPAEVGAMTEAMPDRLRIAEPFAARCALRLVEVLGWNAATSGTSMSPKEPSCMSSERLTSKRTL